MFIVLEFIVPKRLGFDLGYLNQVNLKETARLNGNTNQKPLKNTIGTCQERRGSSGLQVEICVCIKKFSLQQQQ